MFYFIRLLSAFAIFSFIIGLSPTSSANSLPPPKIDENGRLILPNPIQLSKLPTDSKQFFENNNAYEYGARLYIQEVGEQDRTQGYTLYSQRAYNEIESVLGHTPRWESWADKIKAHAESDGSIQIVGHLTTNGIQKKGDYLGSATFRTISKNSRDSTKNHAFSEILPEIRARNYFVDQMERAGNDVLPQDRAKLIENYLYQSTQAKPNEHRAPYIFNPHYRQYVTDGEYYGREADYVRCGRYTYYGLNGSKICRSAPMGTWERTKQDVSGTYQSASEHLDNVWQDTIDKARQDKDQITAGVDAPDNLNFFGWASHHANGLFDAATTIPDAIIRTTRADEALGYAYDKSVPDGVKETISNLKEAHNNWKQNNPNTAEVGEFGVNVGATAVGARAKPPKGVGGGSDGVGGVTTANHANDSFARVGDWDLPNVYDGQKQHPIRDTIYREVELVDQRGSPLGELDGIDLKNMIFYEDKRAGNFNTINPHTGKVQQTESEWAKKQIYKKTEARIQALNTANSTRTTTNGSEKIPTLQEIKNIKHFIFRLEGDTPELRKAVQQEINNLGKKFPNYTFDVIYGSK